MRYPSVVTFTYQAIYTIQQIYLKGSCIEPMFNRGTMYRPSAGVLPAKLRFDKVPQHDSVTPEDVLELDLPEGSISSMILDPPWLISSGCRMSERYGSFDTKAGLKNFIYMISLQAFKFLKFNGILIIKCQDFIHDRRKFFMSVHWTRVLEKMGFNLLDEILVVPKSRQRSNAPGVKHCTESSCTKILVFRKRKINPKN